MSGDLSIVRHEVAAREPALQPLRAGLSPRRVVLVPGVLALLPEYAGLTDPVAELRAACREAVAWLGDGAVSQETAAKHAARSSATGSVRPAYSGSRASTPGTSTTRRDTP